MAKAKEVCALCGAKIMQVVSFCPRCGQPTEHVTAGERVMWELGQWEASRDGSPFAAAANPPVAAVQAPVAAAPTHLRERRTSVEVTSSTTERGAVMHKLRRRGGGQAAAAPALDQPTPAPAPRLQVAPAPAPKPAPKAAKPPKPEKAKKPEKVRPTLDLRPGEAVLGEVRGWTRLRRATLYVTNFRVAMVSFPSRVQWIPHEHIDAMAVRAAGKGLRFESTIDLISFETRKRKDIAAMHELAERYGASARRPGARFDASLVQEWCDRSQEMWDSHTGQFRLWIRRHPVVTFTALGVFVGAARILGP